MKVLERITIQKQKIHYFLVVLIFTLTVFVFAAYGHDDTGKSKCLYWKASVSEHMSEGRVYASSVSFGWWAFFWPWLKVDQCYTYGTDIQLKGKLSSVVILHEFVADPGKYYLGQCPQEDK